MVVLARLAHLQGLAERGYVVRVCMGHNFVGGKTKVKVLCDDVPDVVPPPLRCITMDVLEALKAAAARLVVVDRGHKHSSGASESHFWLGPPPDGGHSSGEPGLPQCPGANPGCSMPGATLEKDAEPTEEAADKVSTAEVTRLRQCYEDDPAAVTSGTPAAAAVAEVGDRLQALEPEAPRGLLPTWELADTERLLRGLARDREDVQRLLLVVPDSELTEIESWMKAQLYHTREWDDVMIENVHLLVVHHGLIQRLQVWLGPECFSRATAPAP